VRSRDNNLDFIAFLKAERFDHCGGKPDGKAISPFCDAHLPLS
jgi:hypothetical protein